MKTLSISLLLLAMFTLSVSAQSTDDMYTKGMEKVISQIDTASTIGTLKKARNQFDRIAQKYTDQWLPVYYVVYCDIEMIYYNPKGDDNQTLLDEAKEKLNELEKLKNVNKSELSTLWGYYYNALIVTDPAANGKKNYNDVMSNYKKAIELDADNPRPVFLLAFFEKFLPPFLQSGKDLCGELKKADVLYKLEKNSTSDIHWGKGFLVMAITKCQ